MYYTTIALVFGRTGSCSFFSSFVKGSFAVSQLRDTHTCIKPWETLEAGHSFAHAAESRCVVGDNQLLVLHARARECEAPNRESEKSEFNIQHSTSSVFSLSHPGCRGRNPVQVCVLAPTKRFSKTRCMNLFPFPWAPVFFCAVYSAAEIYFSSPT